MITLCCYRQHADYAMHSIFSYINLLKLSQLKNAAHLDKTSAEYLSVRLINCLLSEVELIVKKKLVNTTGEKINLKMSHAQGIALYRYLLSMPAGADNYYLNMIRNNWIEILDQQILKI